VLGSWEIFWRSRGFVPMVSDDARLWSSVRTHLVENDNQEIVLIGASRIQEGMDTAVVGESFGRRPLQLAIRGSKCFPVLDHLAKETEFNGLLICEVIPQFFFTGVDTKDGTQASYINFFEKQAACDWLESRMRLWLQQSFVCRVPNILPSEETILGIIQTRKLPRPPFRFIQPDRCRHAYFANADPAALSKQDAEFARYANQSRSVTEKELDTDLELVEEMVQRIEARGGRVIFVEMPVSGELQMVEETKFPRSVYWDKFAARTSGLTIRYMDFSSLSRFRCPDGSHLDHQDAIQFTKDFCNIAKDKLQTPLALR
jgi:hypothetical protein